MKVAYLGAGTWGFSLASLLGSNGHEVVMWEGVPEAAKRLTETREHPKFPGFIADKNVRFTNDLKEALEGADIIVESVTSAGFRPVMAQVKAIGIDQTPIVVTSKGIEQNTCLLLPEVLLEMFGEEHRNYIACVSGPSHAEEVIQKLPTSVVGSALSVD